MGESVAVDRKLCRAMRRQFSSELRKAVKLTDGTQREHGFPICGLQEPKAGPLSSGGRQAVLIPNCEKEPTVAVIHTHNVSEELEKRLGKALAVKYMGHPSADDLVGRNQYRCVATSRALTCFQAAEKPTHEVSELAGKEAGSRQIMEDWTSGKISDREAKKRVMEIVGAQQAAMRSTGGFCQIPLGRGRLEAGFC